MVGMFVGGQPIVRAFVGTQPVKSIWRGDQKIWPSFSRQQMVKVGDASFGFGASQDPVTGWTADTTYPATVTAHKLVVAGGGPATITASLRMRAATGDNFTIRLVRNGTVLTSGTWRDDSSTQTRTLTSTATVAPGDLIYLTATQGFAATSYIYASTYVEVIPT